MRIVHLCTDDVLVGSGRAVARLHAGLKELGHDSVVLVSCRRGTDPTVRRLEISRDLGSRIRRWVRRKRIQWDAGRYKWTRPDGHEPFSDDRTPEGSALARQLPSCDVVNLHHVRGLVDYEQFFPSIPRNVPIVWRLADMGPLTGGCQYDGGCGRFQNRCGACPQLGSRVEDDLSREVWLRKSRALECVQDDRLHLVATSSWIAEKAGRSSLFHRFPISIIPNGLNLEDFAPRDRTCARDVIGIPAQARVVLFVGAMHNPRKGFSLLLKAIAALSQRFPQLLLLTVGSGQPPSPVPVPHVRLGYLDNDRFLSLVYSAAEVFVMPSLQESFGQTVTEAMACGIPVVGFGTGGMTDTIRAGVTGALTPPGDVDALGAAIADMLDATADQSQRLGWSGECRRVAVEEYSLQLQAARFVQLYEKVLRRDHASPHRSAMPIAWKPQGADSGN